MVELIRRDLVEGGAAASLLTSGIVQAANLRAGRYRRSLGGRPAPIIIGLTGE